MGLSVGSTLIPKAHHRCSARWRPCSSMRDRSDGSFHSLDLGPKRSTLVDVFLDSLTHMRMRFQKMSRDLLSQRRIGGTSMTKSWCLLAWIVVKHAVPSPLEARHGRRLTVLMPKALRTSWVVGHSVTMMVLRSVVVGSVVVVCVVSVGVVVAGSKVLECTAGPGQPRCCGAT